MSTHSYEYFPAFLGLFLAATGVLSLLRPRMMMKPRLWARGTYEDETVTDYGALRGQFIGVVCVLFGAAMYAVATDAVLVGFLLLLSGTAVAARAEGASSLLERRVPVSVPALLCRIAGVVIAVLGTWLSL